MTFCRRRGRPRYLARPMVGAQKRRGDNHQLKTVREIGATPDRRCIGYWWARGRATDFTSMRRLTRCEMHHHREVVFHYWAVGGLLTLAFIAACGDVYETHPPTTIVGFFLHIGTVALIGGFYIAMIRDCAMTKSLPHRRWWLVFLALLPLLSASGLSQR